MNNILHYVLSKIYSYFIPFLVIISIRKASKRYTLK